MGDNELEAALKVLEDGHRPVPFQGNTYCVKCRAPFWPREAVREALWPCATAQAVEVVRLRALTPDEEEWEYGVESATVRGYIWPHFAGRATHRRTPGIPAVPAGPWVPVPTEGEKNDA